MPLTPKEKMGFPGVSISHVEVALQELRRPGMLNDWGPHFLEVIRQHDIEHIKFGDPNAEIPADKLYFLNARLLDDLIAIFNDVESIQNVPASVEDQSEYVMCVRHDVSDLLRDIVSIISEYPQGYAIHPNQFASALLEHALPGELQDPDIIPQVNLEFVHKRGWEIAKYKDPGSSSFSTQVQSMVRSVCRGDTSVWRKNDTQRALLTNIYALNGLWDVLQTCKTIFTHELQYKDGPVYDIVGRHVSKTLQGILALSSDCGCPDSTDAIIRAIDKSIRYCMPDMLLRHTDMVEVYARLARYNHSGFYPAQVYPDEWFDLKTPYEYAVKVGLYVPRGLCSFSADSTVQGHMWSLSDIKNWWR